MKYIDLIIFDLDGTLVDSRRDIATAVNFTLKNFGLKEKSRKEITSYIGRGVRDLVRKSLGAKKETLLEKALFVFEDYYRKHFADKSVLYPNVKEALEHFKNKKKVVITNRNHEFALLTLKALGIYEYFEHIAGGDDINCAKPSPCPLDKIIAELSVDKEKTIIVGDMDIDVLAGKGARITTCAVSYGIGKKENIIKAKPDFIIDDISKLKDIIE